MNKKLYILLICLLPLSAALLCPVAATEPIDDVYYWPEQETVYVSNKATGTANSTVSSDSTVTATPAIEYVSVQDTTVTIKIK